MPGLRPTNELVAVAWLKHVTDSYVATDLPQDNSTWSASGFTQVLATGGTPDSYNGVARPVLSVDCWAAPPAGSNRPPWNRANARAEQIRGAVLDHRAVPLLLDADFLPAAYTHAQVLSAVMLTEPRRILSDDASYAHYSFDLQLWWVALP